MSFKPPTAEEWIAEHAPRHEALEGWKALAAAEDKAEGLKTFAGTFTGTVDLPPKPTTLLEMYMGTDLRRLRQDALIRNEHYSQRQHELIRGLSGQEALAAPASIDEQNELLITFMRKEEQDKALKERNRRLSERDDSHEIVLESGKTLAESEQGYTGPTFESQDYGDKILI